MTYPFSAAIVAIRAATAIVGAAAPLALVPAAVQAQEFFAAPRDFVIGKACNATRRISGTEPTALTVGATYPARGFNRKVEPTHVFIRVGEASKWVAVDCGTFADARGATPAPAGASPAARPPAASPAAPPAAQPARAGADGQCLPFFDTVANPVPSPLKVGGRADITPAPPTLDAFEQAINATCGPAGKVVPAAEFTAMWRAHPAVLDRLMAFTGNKVFADRPAQTTREAYLSDLTRAWFAVRAFDHIFCGEPSPGGGKIGGLHFHGRYLQLQQSGEACRMTNFAQNEVVPGVIYTMGVMMKNAGGTFVRDARKGYGLTLSGEDLFKVVTRAFAENPSAGSDSRGCLLSVTDDGQRFQAVFVRRASGIRTFYPDATPNGRGEQQNPTCRAAIPLQP